VISAILIFVTSALNVFALGLQSQNVNGGHYLAAGVNSFFIGGLNLFVLRTIPNTDSMTVLAAYMFSGPAGIVASMWFFRGPMRRWREKWGKESN
jgi:hypothetical protein